MLSISCGGRQRAFQLARAPRTHLRMNPSRFHVDHLYVIDYANDR
jgi:hypothetical protein